jgi:benzoylsuccinyl-CoA thiolase BbsA subunit
MEQDEQSDKFYPSADAWEIEAGKVFLIGTLCPKCGKHAFPQQLFCDRCGNEKGIESVRLSRTGTLYSFSEINVAPKGYEVPYVVGYVDLPEDVRIFGQIENSVNELQVDNQVSVVLGVIRTSENGQPVISYKFRKQGVNDNA